MYFLLIKVKRNGMYVFEFLKRSGQRRVTDSIQRGGNHGWRALRGQMREGEIAPEVVASGAWQRR